MAKFKCQKVAIYINGKRVYDSKSWFSPHRKVKELQVYIDNEKEPCYYLGGPIRPV